MDETLDSRNDPDGFKNYAPTNALVDAAINEVMELLGISDDSED